MNYHELVPIPASTDINTGLTFCRYETMMELFGRPGNFTQDCSPITNLAFKSQIVNANVGPFSVEGWGPAVNSLKAVFSEIKTVDPALYALVRTAGMLCCRAIRGSKTHFSNHSWGCAIDLQLGVQIDSLGSHTVQRGIMALYPRFHAHGWFWGAGFHRPDPMHFELADATVRRLHAEHSK